MANTDFENLRAHAQRGDYTNAHLAQRVTELESALDAAQDDAARLRAALEAAEFTGTYHGWLACPWCGQPQKYGHAPDCQRQAALAQTQEVKA